jgi:hypothetical protein
MLVCLVELTFLKVMKREAVQIELPEICVEKLAAIAAEKGEALSTLIERVLKQRLGKA